MTKTSTAAPTDAPVTKGCDAEGHEDCSGWITCDHVGTEHEPAEGDSPEWCTRCDSGIVAGKTVRAWCPERTN